jgi:quercetin dioxygenase-like cupin family protein
MNARPYINYLLLAVASAWSPTHALAQTIPDSHVVPLKKFAVEMLNKRIEAVHGDRTRPGEPFVIRIHAEAGFIIMPHTHPVDENIVVLKGSWALGMGGHYRKEGLEAMEPGDYGFAGHGMQHFALSKTDTMIQVHGSLGEGEVIGAQCTPGELTQYRIQKQNGERFWGQATDLEVRKGN